MSISPATLIPRSKGIGSPLALRPSLWLRPDSGIFTGGCRTLVAGDKAGFSASSFAAVNFGTGDALITFWANRSATGNQVIFDKYQDADNYWRLEFDAAHKLHFIAKVSGTTKVEITSTTAYTTTGAWINGTIAIDRSAAATTKIYVNGADDTAGTSTTSTDNIDNTGTFYVGQSGATTLFLAGSIASLGIAKPTDVTTVTAAAVASLYNLKNAKSYAELTAAEVTAWNVVWWANCNEQDKTVGLTDQHSTNGLSIAGGELVNNGTFASDLTGWTLSHTSTALDPTWDSGHMLGQSDAAGFSRADQPVATVSGTSYVFAWDVGGAATTTMALGTSAGGTQYGSWLRAAGSYSQAFTATGTTAWIRYEDGNVTAQYVDNISIKATSIAVGNGPSEALATDSVGTAHGAFSGVSAAGLITNWLARGADYAFLFDGTDDTCVCGNLGNVTRITFDVLSVVANQELMTLANSTATAITVVAGTLTFGASLTASNITVDGVAKTAAQAGALINDGTWHTVAFDLTSIAASSVKLATDSSAFGNIYLDNVSFLLSGSATHTYTFSDGPWGIPSDGDPVWMVESREGLRYQLSQTTAGNRPVQRVAAINSKPALEFDGASDYLRVASVVPFAAAATIACVVQPDDVILGTPATQAIIAVQDEASANNFILLGISTDGKATIQGNNAATAFTVTGNTVLSDATAYIIIAQWDGTNWQLSVNGTAQTETRTGTEVAPASISGMDSITLGARYSSATASAWYDGKIAEPYVDVALTAGEVANLVRHWKRRYAIS